MVIKLQGLFCAVYLSMSGCAFGMSPELAPIELSDLQQQGDYFLVKREIVNRLGAEFRGNSFRFSMDDLDRDVRRADYLYKKNKEQNPYQYPDISQLFYKKHDLYTYVGKKVNEHKDWINYAKRFTQRFDINEYQHYPNLTENKTFITMFKEFIDSEQLELKKWTDIANDVRQAPDKYLLNGPFHPHEITGVTQLHEQGIDGEGASVIVWDCGFVNNKHVNFDPNDKQVLKPKKHSDYSRNEEHGTHVAGTIAANKKCGIKKGVAFNAAVLPVDYDGIPQLIDRIKDSDAKIISASFHFLLSPDNFNYLDMLTAELEKNDRLLVMAAGNDSKYLTPELNPSFQQLWARGAWFGNHSSWILKKNPTLAKHILLVGSLKEDGVTVSRFSNLPGTLSEHFLFAPGENVLATVAFDKFDKMSGTSMATPHVSGILTLVNKYFPNLSSEELKYCALNSCDQFWLDPTAKVNHSYSPEIFGAGRINAVKAMALAQEIERSKTGPRVMTRSMAAAAAASPEASNNNSDYGVMDVEDSDVAEMSIA